MEAHSLRILHNFDWNNTSSYSCTSTTRPSLSSIQVQVDEAPSLSEVFSLLKVFMAKHKLIDKDTEQILTRFCWCTDGPWDIQDLLLKTCFISKVSKEIHFPYVPSQASPIDPHAGLDARQYT